MMIRVVGDVRRVNVPGVARFRINAFNQNRGASAVFRSIPSEVLSMDTLGMG